MYCTSIVPSEVRISTSHLRTSLSKISHKSENCCVSLYISYLYPLCPCLYCIRCWEWVSQGSVLEALFYRIRAVGYCFPMKISWYGCYGFYKKITFDMDRFFSLLISIVMLKTGKAADAFSTVLSRMPPYVITWINYFCANGTCYVMCMCQQENIPLISPRNCRACCVCNFQKPSVFLIKSAALFSLLMYFSCLSLKKRARKKTNTSLYNFDKCI